MIKRPKSIDALREFLDQEEVTHINITGPKGIGKTTFLHDLENDGFFGEEKSYEYHILEKDETLESYEYKNNIKTLILDSTYLIDPKEWERYISTLPQKMRLIFVSEEPVLLETVTPIVLQGITFREYADAQGTPVEIQSILTGEADIDTLNSLRDIYIERGSFPKHLTHGESISEDFENKIAIIEQELFDKEKDIFLEFTRTIAMNVGNLFKADQIAKLLDISRRKVNKYTELLLKYDIVRAIGPWTGDVTTETSRHVKLYFTDLGYLKALLGDTHYQGTLKLSALENFIYLELYRKLDDTHTISYYRKKSGAEITFILEDQETNRVTPIEVTLRETDIISQVFRSFDEDYHDRVERYMLVNSRLAGRKDVNSALCLVIPHVAI